jgi:Integrase core domain
MVITFALMLAAAFVVPFRREGPILQERSSRSRNQTRSSPNSGGGRSAQTAARTTDGKDGLLGKFASQRSVAAHLTAEANGIVERFFRSLKEECVWQHNFNDFAEARAAITKWIPFRGLQPKLVA